MKDIKVCDYICLSVCLTSFITNLVITELSGAAIMFVTSSMIQVTKKEPDHDRPCLLES